METGARTCSQCGAASTTRFCGECGALIANESATGDLKALVREGAIEALGFDRRLLATGRDLLLHPRRIVRAHLGGRSAGYVHPFKLFLFLGGLFMLGMGLAEPLSFAAVADDRSAYNVSLTRVVFGADNAAELRQVFAQRGITELEANERFAERANATTPLVTALGLVPLAMLLGAVHRGRPLRDHFTVLLVIFNAIWLLSLLVLPFMFVSAAVAQFAFFVGRYVYLALGFTAAYAVPGRAQTAARFVAFMFADYVITSLVSAALSVAILYTIFYP